MSAAPVSKENAEVYALQALGFILEDDQLRDRFLALTGINGSELRARVSEEGFLLNVLDFLVSHEPDLLNCSTAIDVKPEIILGAWYALGGRIME